LFCKITVGAIALDRPPIGKSEHQSMNVPNHPIIELTELGKCIDETINIINNNDNDVKIDKYVIMPNHIHLIIVIQETAGDRGRSPLQFVVRNIKSYVTKCVNDIDLCIPLVEL